MARLLRDEPCNGQDTLYEGLQNWLGHAHFAAHWRDQNIGRERSVDMSAGGRRAR